MLSPHTFAGEKQVPVPPPVAAQYVMRRSSDTYEPGKSTILVKPPLAAASKATRHSRRKKRTWQEFVQLQRSRLASVVDAPPWLLSLIVHVIFLLILAMITLSTHTSGGLQLTLRQDDGASEGTLTSFSVEPIELDAADNEAMVVPTVKLEPIKFEMPVVLPTLDMSLASSKEVSTLALAARLPSSGSSSGAAMFSGRTGAMKQALLKSGGGNKGTEDAVALGLEWLKRQQRPDGSWSMIGPYANGSGGENATAATAMAMLAFMGAGSTHKSGEYQPQVYKAVKWLAKQQDASGFMAHRARENEKMYAQAQASIVLCELWAMTRDYWIHPYAQKACTFACGAQSSEGGWRYRPRFDSDTSVTGWFVMALKSGQAGGLDISSNTFPRIEKYLDRVGSGYDGGYAYKIGHRPTPAMTAEGLLCRQYLGWHRNMPGMAQGLGALVENHAIDERASDVYYWYYATQSLHHYGGPLWEEWNETMRVALPAAQTKQGAERGSWSPSGDAWGTHAGRLYTTCLSIYCLEVYYRHMPLYGPEDDEIAAK